MSETIKKFLYLNRKAPYGTIYAWESLEVVLIGAAFDQDVSLAFVDDGVYQLTKGQDTAGIGMKNFSPTYAPSATTRSRRSSSSRSPRRARPDAGRPPAPGLGRRGRGLGREGLHQARQPRRDGGIMDDADVVFSF
jgi:hypothetical protein